MATNVSVYVPNQGEKEALRAIIKSKALVLFLYKNPVMGEGTVVFEHLTEWTEGGGGTYARKELSIDIVEDAVAAAKWFLTTNALGRAEGQYNNAVLSWNFNAVDVAYGASVHGVGAFSWVLPFDAGAIEIKVGDKIKGVTSGATGIVTSVCLISGSWGAGTAAGYLDIMTKTGTFQNDENITIVGAIATGSIGNAPGDGYAVGDIFAVVQAGASGGKGVVTTVNAGAVTGFVIVDPGTGYTVGDNKATAKITGAGDDAFTFDVDTLAVTVYAVTNTSATADAHKRLMEFWPFTTPLPIASDGQTATWDMKLALATGT
jgi:hypothetical protein